MFCFGVVLVEFTISFLYPAFMKLFFAFSGVSPLSIAFLIPPDSSSLVGCFVGVTILGCLHLSLNEIVFLVCIRVLLQGLSLGLFCRDRRGLELCVGVLLFGLCL